jgi:hypothetical protein
MKGPLDAELEQALRSVAEVLQSVLDEHRRSDVSWPSSWSRLRAGRRRRSTAAPHDAQVGERRARLAAYERDVDPAGAAPRLEPGSATALTSAALTGLLIALTP